MYAALVGILHLQKHYFPLSRDSTLKSGSIQSLFMGALQNQLSSIGLELHFNGYWNGASYQPHCVLACTV